MLLLVSFLCLMQLNLIKISFRSKNVDLRLSADSKQSLLFRPKDRKCNPSLLEMIGLNSTTPGGQDHVVQWWDAQGIVGLILFLMCVLYSR